MARTRLDLIEEVDLGGSLEIAPRISESHCFPGLGEAY